MTKDWTPIEDPEPSPFNQMLEQWVGLVAVILMILLLLGLVYLFVAYGIPYIYHIPPVSTPIAVWEGAP